MPGLLTDNPEAVAKMDGIRRYRINDEWLFAAISSEQIPNSFSSIQVEWRTVPHLASTLTLNAFLGHLADQGFRIEPAKGQARVVRERNVDGIPAELQVYEGLLVKPFYAYPDDTLSMGLVFEYVSEQEFRQDLQTDVRQLSMAKAGYEVSGVVQGRKISGKLLMPSNSQAMLLRGNQSIPVDLSKFRLNASYATIRAYFQSQPKIATEIIRKLMVASLSLSPRGFANSNKLADSFGRVSHLLGASKAANINIVLPTLCKTIISISTSPMVVGLS